MYKKVQISCQIQQFRMTMIDHYWLFMDSHTNRNSQNVPQLDIDKLDQRNVPNQINNPQTLTTSSSCLVLSAIQTLLESELRDYCAVCPNALRLSSLFRCITDNSWQLNIAIILLCFLIISLHSQNKTTGLSLIYDNCGDFNASLFNSPPKNMNHN